LNQIFLTNENIETASLYSPINNEISPNEFINYLEKKNVTLSLPATDIKTETMFFKEWKPGDELIKGPLGSLEPLRNKKTILPQILVVPMLSFDKELYRLGYGGGYYDKSINFLKNYFKKQKKFFITIGLAYSIQEEKKIPRENHDMRLDFIITEKEVLSNFNQKII
jgi:5-formyltetrahydrofolate cyclo-ligase